MRLGHLGGNREQVSRHVCKSSTSTYKAACGVFEATHDYPIHEASQAQPLFTIDCEFSTSVASAICSANQRFAEIRRRRKQSLRDKERDREKEQELLRLQEQSQRNKNRRGPSASYFSYTNTMSHNKELFSRPSTHHPPTTLKPEQLGHKLASILSKYVTTTPRP